MTSHLMRSFAVVAVLAAGVPAAEASQEGTRSPTIAVPLQELPSADSFGERAERLWGDFLGMFRFGSNSSHYMRRSAEIARGHAQMREDFSALMEMAGYKLKEIESSVGLIPTLQMTFGQARELTEADREYIERQLERHARRYTGPVAAIQRTIVRTIVDASDMGGFSVEKVEIDFFPLPRVKFALAPSDAPLGIDAARIMRAIDGLNRRLQQMPNRQSGFDMPPSDAPSAVRPATIQITH